MGIVMAGIDYSSATVEEREPFSMTTAQVEKLLRQIKEVDGVEGCVLISTCNRTELYLSCQEEAELNPARILCEELGLPLALCALFVPRGERETIRHLMQVAAGLRSQIRGEDQVLAQVKTAIDTAREQHCADPVLETLFRTSISAGKRAKTDVPLHAMESSTAHRALEVLGQCAGDLRGMRAMVIGNGEMGKLSARLLREAGCRVTVTVRSYRHGGVVVPDGCGTIAYDDRYDRLSACDIVVSATTSPHYTLRADELRGLAALPRYFVDLAVPRDIDPAVGELPGVDCWNVDTLGGGELSEETGEKLRAIHEIIDRFIQRFDKWQGYRAMMPAAVTKRAR